MNNIKVSVIIPIYNVEEYLKQCLDSLVNQTLNEIEMICVNDGSTDSSLQILEEYAQKDERIKVINKENEGLGAARNTGMEHAIGEYIGFVDSDDWIELDAYEKLYKNAKYYNSDMVMCPIHIYDNTTKELKYNQPYFKLDCFNENFDNCTFDHTKTKDFLFKISVTAWNKIYRKSFLDKINAKFPEGLIFEDNPFFYETYLKAKNVSLVRDFLYFYRVNRADSIIVKADEKYFDLIKIQDLSIQNFIETNNFDEYKFDLLSYVISNLFYRYTQINEIYKEEFFNRIKQCFDKMDLKTGEIEKLDIYSQNAYLNVKSSGSFKEVELLEKIKQLEITHEKEMQRQKQIYENKIEKITSSNSWKLTKPFRSIGMGIKKTRKAK